ncbi:MAG: hypothetical protein AAF518_18380 [Spirochaetota bacterium]
MSHTCPQCGASLISGSTSCEYCGCELEVWKTQEQESLAIYIRGLEKILRAKQDMFEGRVITFFLASLLAWGGTIYALYLFLTSLTLVVVFSLLSGFTYFITFGWYTSSCEKKAHTVTYETQIRKDIEEYLIKNHIDKQDFKILAMETLRSTSPLYPFLIE